eukprot:CAMPEP_0183707860 /NCGR_PEP_ID=MMETSP0737-20130205/4290_1 /TAXON_ID=385413 /ORGANISM="Thalassiosira miniscula, Strain CCMP1093" /LENGTH=540 /DNA_ID=CAMNT_0025935591 /DNA_START=79 /DNA_END=1701 /DNA_ORIENTATION=-
MIALQRPASFFLVALGSGLLSSSSWEAHGFIVKTAEQSQPPMPFQWPIVGTLPDFFARGGVDRLRDIYGEMYFEYGPVFAMSPMNDFQLILADPYVFDTVIRREGKIPIGGAAEGVTFQEYYKENNITKGIESMGNTEEWREWRKELEPDMYARWAEYLPMIADTAKDISKVAGYEITEQKSIPFIDFLSRASFDMFNSVLYGTAQPRATDSRTASDVDIEFVDRTIEAFDLTGQMIVNPLERVFETDTYSKFKVNMDWIFGRGAVVADEYVEGLRSEQKQQQQQQEEGIDGSESKCPVSAITKNMPLVERLFNRGEYTMDDIRNFSGPMQMAGVDTTTYVMSWLYLNLATNPTAQTKLASELKSVLNGADVTTLEQMNSLPYLKACIRESHRLTPTVPAVSKRLKEDIDVVIPNDKSYRVEAGRRIMLNLRGIPMDPAYVTDPHLYLPERFLKDAVDARKGTPSEVIDHPSFADPFGRGKRRCLGSNIANAEIMVLAARLFQEWEITLEDPKSEGTWKPQQRLMLKADPYPNLKLVPRV